MAQQNPFVHPPGCQCESCQDWRDAQLGLSLLAQLKKAKEGSARPQQVIVIIDGDSRGEKRPSSHPDGGTCPTSGKPIPRGAHFCPFCGAPVR